MRKLKTLAIVILCAVTGVAHAQGINLEESDLILQNAQDVLKQIEGDNFTPPAPSETSLEKIDPPEAPAPAESVQNVAYKGTLSYEGENTSLAPEHTDILLKDILGRLQGYSDARLEIRAFAVSDAPQESVTRRISLSRALEVQGFLLSKGIPERQIYIRPLGQSGENPQNSITLVISRL